jgi:queuine tRNA-ribosyltransferase
MALAESPPSDAPRVVVADATVGITRWAARSRDAFEALPPRHGHPQWLFGIVQGGVHLDLRERSAVAITALDFPGYAIGGLSVGEKKEDMIRVLDHVPGLLPADRPRYLMGVGDPVGMVEAVALGIDMFDCVLPTRNARNGQLFTSRGRLSIRNAVHRDDPRPPDPECACYTCRTVSRAYLRHLHLAGEMGAAIYATIHNLTHYVDTMRAMRQSILLGRFEEFRQQMRSRAAAGVDEP